VVFSRYGGMDTFNLAFCREVIKEIVQTQKNIYFLFINTPEFFHHNQIMYLPSITSDRDKQLFIETSDAHLESSNLGHSFGLAIGEYSVHNKPIIAYTGQVWNTAHLEILGTKALGFKNAEEFKEILETFNPETYQNMDMNCYREYTPVRVMTDFKRVFIDGNN
jgi:hypothetical protein